ncbi:ABC transporter substrate-binding protein [Cohnella faecalis]|uniref:Carbohydrate ABC transporter substrate-binding protein n=1 Tax=Cohnella faecalis TaxID=2315694 RepID=A0A398CEL7_9BACL|nr:ABC transporter substrate-binding protein [Cohnella faecalis]RIE01070.1 carbohydrate ABC transporter substrate-binding protein [Cohnella faecalis]
MRKMKIASMLLLLAGVSVIAACSSGGNGVAESGNASSGAAATGTGSGGATKTVKMLNFKVEIKDQLAAMIKEYEQLTPGVKIALETIGGGADSAAALRTKFSSGDQPDIFLNGGYKELDLWLEHLEDLSDQPWAEHVLPFAKEPMTKDGKLYGQPLNLEGYGFIYNKDLFKQAGITELPKTFDELEAAAAKLQAAGITPFVNGYGEWWVLGNHLANIGFAYQDNPDTFIAGLDQGTATFVDNEKFQQWVKLFDLTLKYGGKNSLQVDYNTQISEFATGKAAMTQQGNWTQVSLSETNPSLNIGLLPMPINNDAEAMDKLPVGVPYSWVVYNKSKVKDEAKAFLDWMVSSDIGKRYMTEEFKHIPAFDNITANNEILGQLAADIIAYSQANRTISWNWFKFPGGEATSHYFSDAMQGYVGGQLSKEAMLKEFLTKWNDLNK